MAYAGQPLSAVAAQAGQVIQYKCRKGQCGTCEVRVDGQWIRTCSVQVPHVDAGEEYKVFVRASKNKSKKASRFFSFRSFVAGAKNNILGMIGFVREGRKSQGNFKDRLAKEAEIERLVAERKAAKVKKS
jgi:hypothetical protein